MRSPHRLEARRIPYRTNSLNLFRLILAAMVLFAHASTSPATAPARCIHGENLGGWAVAGFFVLSGFLITAQPAAHIAGRVPAPPHRAHLPCVPRLPRRDGVRVRADRGAASSTATLGGFLTTPVTPLEYIWGNLTLVHRLTTHRRHPADRAVSRRVERLAVDALLRVPLLHHRLGARVHRPLPQDASGSRSRCGSPRVVVYADDRRCWRRLGLDQNFSLLFKLLPFFLGGVVAYVSSNAGACGRPSASRCLVAALADPDLPDPRLRRPARRPVPRVRTAVAQSTVVRQPAIIAKHDVSYGFYIYAWPTAQLLVLARRRAAGGSGSSWRCNVLVTLVFAAASWLLIERPVMRRVKRQDLPKPVDHESLAEPATLD